MPRSFASSNLAALFLASLALACATATKTYTPSGNIGYSIECSGRYLSWSECYEKAGEKCGARGYRIVDKIGDEGGHVQAGAYGAYGEVHITRTLVVECGGS